jgi:hypothetical protein
MKIVFFVDTLGRTRHFRNVIQGLLERRHTLVLATAQRPRHPAKGLYEHELVEVVSCPSRRSDRWASVVEPLRGARDRVRFLDPRYAQAARLEQRAADHAPKGWNRALDQHRWLNRHWKLVDRALALVEAITPCDPEFERFLEAQAADLVIVTPLVEFGSYQTDVVKCAHRLGVPVVFPPFSWDNLTNRGLIRVLPDRVLVWNTPQAREAVELQQVPADRVVVTGAPRFDDFLAMRPSTSRAEFCGRLGLDAARPVVLYVCSASFIAPREVGFVRQWIQALRADGGSWLRDCGVLVRPHPANQDEWITADLSDLPAVALWSQRSSMTGDQGLYDSLFHSAAVVGLNTSAMIEAAIVGRPVYTTVTDESAGGQTGTLHFQHLLVENGGIVSVSRSFGEHVGQLRRALDETEDMAARARRFLEQFVRPRGMEVPASDVMVGEIERAGSMRKRPRTPALWHYPLRWAFSAALAAGFDPTLSAPRR